MTEFKLPYIRFGRKADTSAGGEDYYAVLECSPTIPTTAVELFERKVSRSVQWDASGGCGRFADCFLAWRIDKTSFWFTRLSDAGNDSRGRSHAMQIDALYLDEKTIQELPEGLAVFLTFLCHHSDWRASIRDTVCLIS